MSHTWLLAALLFLLVVEPFLSDETSTRWAFDAMLSGVLIAAVWSIGRNRKLLAIGVLLALPALAAKWGLYVAPSWSVGMQAVLFALALLAFTAIVILGQVLTSTTVTLDTLAGAISVYLLMGVIWAMVFALIELAHPGSFQIGGQPLADIRLGGEPQIAKFLYLSLVTLATVGYGDALPVTAVARRMAVLEAIIGQLYLAVLIARLVSLRASPPDPSATRRT